MTAPDIAIEQGLPASIDAERSLLGAILLENNAYHEAAEVLTPDDFALDSHQRLFARMGELLTADPPRNVDIVTLVDALGRRKEVDAVGGVAYIFSLTEGLPRRLSVAEYVLIVREKSIARQMIKVLSLGITEFHDQSDNANDVRGRIEAQIQMIGEKNAQRGLMTVESVIRERYPNEESIFERSKGIATGFTRVDAMMGGLKRKELTLIAARPSMGKTAFGSNIAEYSAFKDAKTVAFFSLEMDRDALLLRAACSRGLVSFDELQKGTMNGMDQAAMLDALRELKATKLYIDDSADITVPQMRAKCMHLKFTVGLDLVIVDYLQLMTAVKVNKSDTREQEVSRTGRGLKAMAKALDVPVVALAQLNRASGQRTDKKPILSDLRESGSLEQDADNVLFLHRAEYYERDNAEVRGKGTVIFAKQRNGPLGEVELEYHAESLRWTNVLKQSDLYSGEF